MLYPQRRVLEAFSAEGVRFLVIGGHAVRAYAGVDRVVRDIDLWAGPKQRIEIARAFAELGAPGQRYGEWMPFYSFVNPTLKIADIFTLIPGMDFEVCYARRVMVELGGLTVPAIARGDLIEMKHRSSFFGNDEAAKARDRADLDVLEARFV